MGRIAAVPPWSWSWRAIQMDERIRLNAACAANVCVLTEPCRTITNPPGQRRDLLDWIVT